MFQLGKKIEAFATKAPAAVLVRAVLQRDLNPERMNQLFHDAAELQYENKLLFSTVMMLMIDVSLKSVPSLNRAYLLHQEEIPVSVKALYDKVNGLEKGISRELVVDSFHNLAPVVEQLKVKHAPFLQGFRTLILDGNHFAATQRRLKELRNKTAAPLPGKALALFDQEYGMVCDVIPCEDGHTQERALLGPILEQIRLKDCLIGGRIVVVSFMFGNVVGVGGHGDSGGTEGLESIDRRLVAVVLWKTVTRVGRPHEFVEIQKIASKTKVAAAEAGYRRRTTRLHRPSPRRTERKNTHYL